MPRPGARPRRAVPTRDHGEGSRGARRPRGLRRPGWDVPGAGRGRGWQVPPTCPLGGSRAAKVRSPGPGVSDGLAARWRHRQGRRLAGHPPRRGPGASGRPAGARLWAAPGNFKTSGVPAGAHSLARSPRSCSNSCTRPPRWGRRTPVWPRRSVGMTFRAAQWVPVPVPELARNVDLFPEEFAGKEPRMQRASSVKVEFAVMALAATFCFRDRKKT